VPEKLKSELMKVAEHYAKSGKLRGHKGESKAKKKAGFVYGWLNKHGYMHGNKETAKGRAHA
jgi:hypothetical protein